MAELLSFDWDTDEDYYNVLGCDPSSTYEQIISEFKIRAKELHPDKCSDDVQIVSQEKFKALLEAKNTLSDPELRLQYDAWKSSGMVMKFKQWMAIKDSVKTSMHWAKPKTSGRMLQGVPEQQSDSTKSSNQESRGPGMTSPGSIDGVANVDQERFQRNETTLENTIGLNNSDILRKFRTYEI